MSEFTVVDIPQNGYERRTGNPFYDKLAAALKSLPKGKALIVPVPEGKKPNTFGMGIKSQFRSGRLRNSGLKIRTSIIEDKLFVWVKE
ncbi:MAG: hypothetical protein L0312_26705 [Acidobacteria bacterium]|nr:hypothetical protein [Acidobacteriota bacterium]